VSIKEVLIRLRIEISSTLVRIAKDGGGEATQRAIHRLILHSGYIDRDDLVVGQTRLAIQVDGVEVASSFARH
jgi:hypothetical protein